VGKVVVRLEGFSPAGKLAAKIGPLEVAAQQGDGAVELVVQVPHGAPIGVYPVELSVDGIAVGGLGTLEVTPITAAPGGDDGSDRGTTLAPFRSLSKSAMVAGKGDRIALKQGIYSQATSGEIFPVELPPEVEVEGQGLVTLNGLLASDLLVAKGTTTIRSLLLSGARRGLVVPATNGGEVLLEDVEMEAFAEQGVDIEGAGKAAVTLRQSGPTPVRPCEIRESTDEALRVKGPALVALQGCTLRAKKNHAIHAEGASLVTLVDTHLIGAGEQGPLQRGVSLVQVGLFEMEGGSIEKFWIALFPWFTDVLVKGTAFVDNLREGNAFGYGIDPCGGTTTLDEITLSGTPLGIYVFPTQLEKSCAGTKLTLRKSKVTGSLLNALISGAASSEFLVQDSDFSKNATGTNAAIGVDGSGSKLRIEDSRILDSGGYGVYVGDGARLELEGTAPEKCLIQGSALDGVLLHKDGYEAAIKGCVIEESGWSGISAGFIVFPPGPPVQGTLSVSDTLLRNNNQQKLSDRAGIVVHQVGATTLDAVRLEGNKGQGLLLTADSSGATVVTGGSITTSAGDAIVARASGSLTLQGVQVGKSGQGNLGHGLRLDGTKTLAVKIRGSTFASNQFAAIQVAGADAAVDLGNSAESGGNTFLNNVAVNLGKLPADTTLAELLDLRTGGDPLLVRGLTIDGAPFLGAPQLLSGPASVGPLGHRFGLRITGQGSVQSF
jgi:hypothetical protein